MCHYCGGELTKLDDKSHSENKNPLELNSEDSSWICKSCLEMEWGDFLRQDRSHMATPSMTPASSFSSSDRSLSNSSEYSVDTAYERSNQEDLPLNSSNVDRDSTPNKSLDTNTVRKEEVIQHSLSQREKEENVQNIEQQNKSLDSYPMEAEIWDPPEPENPEDEEPSVANHDYGVNGNDEDDDEDEDDECCGGTQWGKPSDSTDSAVEPSKSFKLKEEKQRAMLEVAHRKFKAIVNQLLKSVGIFSSAKDSENWVDIVSSLSWEAASSLQRVVIEGKPVDPNAYVKVKCIATGSPSHSQVVRGLVFKKHAALKRMPTKYKKPRVLLVEGVLGQSPSGLSSMDSMKKEQEDDYATAVVKMIEMCHPNVVLVEKSVSRAVQECILSKGITLVSDMKRHRLERVARCTGSQTVSLEAVSSQKLKKCDSFYIERFLEEHAVVAEGEKKPSKTLMFLEGCPTHLGCTILLKGSHNDELKRIKEVVQSVFILAYHLILETYFLVDQQTMFSTIPLAREVKILPLDEKFPAVESQLPIPGLDESTKQPGLLDTVDVPISSGLHEQSSAANRESEGDHFDNGVFDGDSVFSYETYNPAVLNGISYLSSALRNAIGNRVPYGPLSHYLGLDGGAHDENSSGTVPVFMVSGDSEQLDVKFKGDANEEKLVDTGKNQLSSVGDEGSAAVRPDDGSGEDGSDGVLDSRSILVLMSRRNMQNGTICEQSHFSHIMFYKNFDVPLGRFLQDNLFNPESRCNACEEPPEAHFYFYAHRNKQLTIQIKRLPDEKCLPGKAEGKLWMWSCCSKCNTRKGSSRSTKRVLISAAARGLSFGKFLELGLSRKVMSGRLSSCGHSLDRDFLYFFGLGSMVAMFRYSHVTTYTVSLPPQKMEFNSSIKTGNLEREFENVRSALIMVFKKGISLFVEISSLLSGMRSHFPNSTPKLLGSHKDFSDIEEMLKKERSEFEEIMRNAFENTKSPGRAFCRLLSLNRIRWELLLYARIWDRRLASLFLPDTTINGPSGSEESVQEAKTNAAVDNARNNVESGDRIVSCCNLGGEGNEYVAREIPVSGPSVHDHEGRGHQSDTSNVPNDPKEQTLNNDSDGETCLPDNARLSGPKEVDKSIPITREPGDAGSEQSDWFWLPFASIRHKRIEDLERVYLSKIESVCGWTAKHLKTAYEILVEEGARIHVSLGDGDYVLSDYEDELSSLIACALAQSRDSVFGEPGMRSMKTKSLDANLDSVALRSKIAASREDSRFTSFDGLNLLELAGSPESLRREVSFGKSLGKSKYSVTCMFPDQFRSLRKRCCPSEIDYIASLSRCKNWDAKGGKSKSVFAKTLDDRFIIKEIKKTEYDSFVKFAPDYFQYMNESFEVKNQTCLSKILGIYQVTIRQPKSGREIRHDLMVMENLAFGRNLTRQYDLKGALHARFTTAKVEGDVLLDQNFVNDMNSSPLYVSSTSKRRLQRAVYNDTSFLTKINVMDYSLLVGVDTEREELVCGIIDYLRQYTWDKQLETWVKASLVPKNLRPTIISPIEYKVRFRKFMTIHFLSVPDDWCEQGSSGTTKDNPDRSDSDTQGNKDDPSGP